MPSNAVGTLTTPAGSAFLLPYTCQTILRAVVAIADVNDDKLPEMIRYSVAAHAGR